jgi:cyclopropane fatty-acyl-phospholipid synthase-like methyltransferase
MLSRYLLENAGRYVGVDYSVKALNAFYESASSQNVPKIILRNSLSTDFEIKEFDCCISYASFHYVADFDEATEVFRQLLSYLKTGGKMLIGNIPENDLDAGLSIHFLVRDSFIIKIVKCFKYIFHSSRNSISSTSWRVKSLVFQIVMKTRRNTVLSSNFSSVSGCLDFNIETLNMLFRQFGESMNYSILPTYSFSPLNLGRCDVLIVKR